MNAELKLRKARIQLIKRQPFFGTLALHLELVKTNSIPSTAVDGKNNLLYNEDFINKIQLEPCIGVVAHEVMHLALDVFGRRKGRDPFLFNVAHDYSINPLILESGLRMPDEDFAPLIDEKFKDKQTGEWMNAEKIYSILEKEKKKNKKKEEDSKLGFGTGNCCDHNSTKGESKAKADARKEFWKGKVIQAAQAAQQRGTLPAGIKRLVDGLLQPELPWQEILKSFISNAVLRKNYSYRRPSRRTVATGIYSPSMPPDVGIPAFAFDTSGSISEEFLKKCLSEAAEALNECRATARFLSIDADVHSDIETDDIWEVAQSIAGGGGTDFIPIFKKLEEDPPCALIFFSDMYAAFPDEHPRYPVLWVCPPKHGEIPFGSYVEIKE